MKERLVLEMVRDRRIAVADALTLLGYTETKTAAATTEPRPIQRRVRRAKTQNVITVERHFEIVRVGQEVGVRAAARRLGLPSETVANHMRYAGISPISPSRVREVETWRKRRNLYLDTPIMISEGVVR